MLVIAWQGPVPERGVGAGGPTVGSISRFHTENIMSLENTQRKKWVSKLQLREGSKN